MMSYLKIRIRFVNQKKLEKGGEDDFGKLGFDRLGGAQGKEFRKEKTKLKNRQYQGGKITFSNNLVDLDL